MLVGHWKIDGSIRRPSVSCKSDNWKTFYGILEKLSVDGPIDIYAGTSKVVRYPADDGRYEMKNFTYKVDATTIKTVPLQIWNYIKPRNQNISEVVVVGINSPFLGSEHIWNLKLQGYCLVGSIYGSSTNASTWLYVLCYSARSN
ncbi:unnamed protein product [Hermetia illucens]|uniref:Uncharacterized protein n=1 Tax=Hermetia illucens TaxID=343691 RepID=A0A7R8USE4_HERIL|nr:unnamed protein product [Hermetia illucens]